MITPRDIDKVLSLLRRVYGSIVIDMSSVLNDINLAFLDLSDTILEIVTYDSTTIHNTVAVADAFRMHRLPARRRSATSSTAPTPPAASTRATSSGRSGACPSTASSPDGQLVVQSNNEGVPVRAGRPERPDQPGRRPDRRRDPRGPRHGPRAGRGQALVGGPSVGSATDRRLRLRCRRPDGPARDPPPDAPRSRRSTSATTPGRRTGSGPTRRSGPSRPRRSTRSSSATSRRSSSPATRRPPWPSATSGGATTCRSWASSGPGAVTAALTTRNRRVGVIATPATVRSHAYFTAIKDENPAVEVYEHATPAFVPLVEAGRLSGPEVEAAVAEGLAPLLGERDAAGEFVFPLPASARIDTLLLGCTHYPLLLPVIAAVAGEGVAIVDSATATASALSELLAINGLEAPSAGAQRAHPHPAHDRRRCRLPLGRRQAVRRRVPRRGARRARRRSRRDRTARSAAGRPGATIGSGRRGSSSARRSVPRRRSSAGGPSGSPGAASSTGRGPSGSRPIACARRPAP